MFEHVHMVWDIYDGVRSGLADFHGNPHYFECVFEDGDYTDSFKLSQVDQGFLRDAKEQWAIYRAWERKFHGGEVPVETHPGHGGIVPRYDELETSLKTRLESLPKSSLIARAEFRVIDPQPELPHGCLKEIEVQWTPTA